VVNRRLRRSLAHKPDPPFPRLCPSADASAARIDIKRASFRRPPLEPRSAVRPTLSSSRVPADGDRLRTMPAARPAGCENLRPQCLTYGCGSSEALAYRSPRFLRTIRYMGVMGCPRILGIDLSCFRSLLWHLQCKMSACKMIYCPSFTKRRYYETNTSPVGCFRVSVLRWMLISDCPSDHGSPLEFFTHTRKVSFQICKMICIQR
jgi:hypothetical protein